MGVARFQSSLKSGELVQNLLKPQFIDLVDRDEEQLIVLRSLRKGLLECEQLIDLQIGRVGNGFVVIGSGHQVTLLSEAPTSRYAPDSISPRKRSNPSHTSV